MKNKSVLLVYDYVKMTTTRCSDLQSWLIARNSSWDWRSAWERDELVNKTNKKRDEESECAVMARELSRGAWSRSLLAQSVESRSGKGCLVT